MVTSHCRISDKLSLVFIILWLNLDLWALYIKTHCIIFNIFSVLFFFLLDLHMFREMKWRYLCSQDNLVSMLIKSLLVVSERFHELFVWEWKTQYAENPLCFLFFCNRKHGKHFYLYSHFLLHCMTNET